MRQATKETTPLPTREGQGGGSPFLYHVAHDLIARYGNNLSGVTIVFPGKRAELYMNTFLSHIAQGPVWAPRFITIDELFQQFSPLTPSDNIQNVCRLYRIYAQLVKNPEPLDEFYGWGEILMNDFGDIDKHMVDAEKLFANAADLARLDSVDYLSEEQIKALQQFFSHFDPQHQTDIKRRFMEMWQAMPEMYRRLHGELRREGMLYKGALYREVAEKMKNEELGEEPGSSARQSAPVYCFVGFNVLDEVEETLFSTLRDKGQALFYWDYDVYYAARNSDHEAGLFLRHNLQHYPNALEESIYNNLTHPDKKIRILATSTDNAQARYLPQWLREKLTQPENETAIVLCDEALMRPTLHAIPPTVKANITMGFPLTDTAVHGYFCALIDLQIDGYNRELGRFQPTALERVEKNPFFRTFPAQLLPLSHQEGNLALIDWLTEVMEALGQSLTDTTAPYDQLYTEATFQLYKMLGQFRWLVADGMLNIRPDTLRRLIRQALATASIPFHGEMDEGVQVMGLLEARNLDFRHLIMLSVGEGIIPRRSSDTSLIPYILRAHFGLDTTERQDSVYAYSFFRLLQRAEDITLVYNSNSSGASQREQSRFLRQLTTETQLDIEQLTDSHLSPLTTYAPIEVVKDKRIMDILGKKNYLSPTAINQYLGCPLQFYYQQVARLRMPDRPQDGIDNARFGTIFHDTCELFYTHLQHMKGGNKEVQRSDLEPLFSESGRPSPIMLMPYINLIFWVDFFHALEYDSHTHPQERETFMAPYERAASRGELSRMVGELYADGQEGDAKELEERYFTGVNMIIRDVLLKLFAQLLRWDMAHTPFTMMGMEDEVKMTLRVPCGQGELDISIGGRIDRMDIMPIDGRPALRVVDYKTGHSKPGPKDVEGIFDGTAANAHAYYLQTFLYSLIMSRREPSLPVVPCLFYVLSATDAQAYNPVLKIDRDYIADIRDHADEYLEGLRRVLAQIFDPTVPFTQTTDAQKHCTLCDFRCLCGR